MQKIVNFGSLNLDKVYQVPHFVRAGETITSVAYAAYLGGKGLNQSIAMARAGAHVWHAGKIGLDGLTLIDALQQEGIHTEWVRSGRQQTGHAIIQVDPSGQNSILLHGGANRYITEAEAAEALNAFEAGDILVLQNELNLLEFLIRIAKENGLYVVLNPSPITPELLAMPLDGVDLLILNEIEADALIGSHTGLQRAQVMAQRCTHTSVLLTLGADGAQYFDQEYQITQPAFPVTVTDTTAAGDTMLGYFVARRMLGDDPAQALALASAAAALAVSTPGACQSIPSLLQVQKILAQYHP